MTLEEEIQNQEEQAMAYKSMGNMLSMNISTEKQFRAKECYHMSDYHRQFAEWLRELKAYEEAREEIIRKRDSGQWSETVVFGLNRAIRIIDKHLKEVNNDTESR